MNALAHTFNLVLAIKGLGEAAIWRRSQPFPAHGLFALPIRYNRVILAFALCGHFKRSVSPLIAVMYSDTFRGVGW